MSLEVQQLATLRKVINENLRVQRAGADPVPYIDVSSALSDICARQNHAVFARRGCGKTLLLHHSAKKLPSDVQPVYLNCEDFKHHSFPNVLIEVLDALFAELQGNLPGWFGKKKRSRELIAGIRRDLAKLRQQEDESKTDVVESHTATQQDGAKVRGSIALEGFGLAGESTSHAGKSTALELRYAQRTAKLRELQTWLPQLKRQIREFFELSKTVKTVFLQLDDYYHLARADQPDVMDYLHRLCKDLPLYFKVATLRHSSTLYADREGQPIGAQERHDYQPINIDFAFTDFRRTANQNCEIFGEFAKLAGLNPKDIDSLFKGEGFDRLIMAGGGVPRDCLSLFLEALQGASQGDGRIGKDDVRIMSRSNFERRIEELKQDSAGDEQATLIRGIYVLRKFCIDKRMNIMMVSEEMMQQEDQIRALLYRLLDYRIMHSAGTALTHKSSPGTYQAFAIDIGCYAHMRKLQGRFNEIDVADTTGRERMRSAPILTKEQLHDLWSTAPDDVEGALRHEDEEPA
ncbi:MAG: hypothetical protein GY778_26175 [bacterium]|nr:hypothetical protein [bacterium]